MPTWPKGTKASTANVDAGSDQISSARADIKQNIDNVNDIIDTFDIQPDSAGQPANGDLLQYDSATTTWKPIAQDSISSGASANIVVFDSTVSEDSAGGVTDYRGTYTLLGSGGITTSTNTLTIPAGTYTHQSLGNLFPVTGVTSPYDSDEIIVNLVDNTGTILTTSQRFKARTTSIFFGFNAHFTLASETVCRIENDLDDAQGGPGSAYQLPPMLLTKIS